MRLKPLYSGTWRVVAVVNDSGVCELEQELLRLAENPKLRASVLGFRALWGRIGPTGPRSLGTPLYHRVDQKEEIYEFIKGNLRLLCFEADGAVVVCSHVFRKASQKTPPREVSRAVSLKRLYQQARARESVEFIDGSS
ncbi:MAG: hypothetical protein KatS3mg128_0073 [Silanimonas sp.]|nr:MAG: hypothetical protein KatS3mg128_0073 [Silanimonas sp.]